MKEKIGMVVFIVILGTILTTALVAVDNYTAPLIAHNKAIKEKSSILKAFKILYSEDDIEQAFIDNITVMDEAEGSYYVARDGTIAFLFGGSGLWGPIEGVLSMDKNMKTIKKIEIMHQEETPGLGSRIAERLYLDSFRGKIFAPDLKMVPEGRGSKSNEIDSITGATMSCNAFIAILNEQYEQFRAMISMELGE